MATEPAASIGFFGFLPQAVTIVLGWIVVHRLSSTRDRDKARRELVVKAADGLSDIADDLLIKARFYHLNPRGMEQEIQIKMALQDASLRTNGLGSVCVSSSELATCRTALTGLKQAITSRHFEDEHAHPLDETSAQLQDIAAEVMRVKQAFLRLKHSQFPA
jgi:hypothetical protein